MRKTTGCARCRQRGYDGITIDDIILTEIRYEVTIFMNGELMRDILAYHVVFCTYGFWLPNDPRGSWSERVFAVALQPFGEATKVNTRHSRAHDQHDHQKRWEAKKHLMFPPVRLTGQQALVVSQAMADVVAEIQLAVYACCIMLDHVHFVMPPHERSKEAIVQYFKSAATKRLNERRLHPLENQRSPWSRSFWDVYLHTEEQILRAVQYINNNPIKEGYKPQNWRFVTPYVP